MPTYATKAQLDALKAIVTTNQNNIASLTKIHTTDIAAIKAELDALKTMIASLQTQSHTHAIPTDPPTPPPSNAETRACWLQNTGIDTLQEQLTNLNTIEKMNLNTVYLLAPPIGVNHGWSNPTNFITMAQRLVDAGIQRIGVWVCNLFRPNDGSIADFRTQTEQLAQVQWISDLLYEYPFINEVHLDYIREKTYANPNTFPLDRYRFEGVLNTVQLITQMVKEENSSFLVSAAVFRPEPNHMDTSNVNLPLYYRDWYKANPTNWFATVLNDGQKAGPQYFCYHQDAPSFDCDYIVPMQYTVDTPEWCNALDLWIEFLGLNGKSTNGLSMGLGWKDIATISNPAHVLDKIAEARRKDIRRFSIFCIGGRVETKLVDDSILTKILTEGDLAPFATRVDAL